VAETDQAMGLEEAIGPVSATVPALATDLVAVIVLESGTDLASAIVLELVIARASVTVPVSAIGRASATGQDLTSAIGRGLATDRE
jgi:hypothetical protein